MGLVGARIERYEIRRAIGIAYVATALVPGPSLRALIGADASMSERMRWLVELASALAEAHRLGVVHRDVKPENILVEAGFGI